MSVLSELIPIIFYSAYQLTQHWLTQGLNNAAYMCLKRAVTGQITAINPLVEILRPPKLHTDMIVVSCIYSHKSCALRQSQNVSIL